MGDVTCYVLEKAGQLDLHDTVPIGEHNSDDIINCSMYITC